jgi:hypothetical protein
VANDVAMVHRLNGLLGGDSDKHAEHNCADLLGELAPAMPGFGFVNVHAAPPADR